MTGFEKRLAILEEVLKKEQHKRLAFNFFVFKYLDELNKRVEPNKDLLNLGFHDKAELAKLLKDKDPDVLESLSYELNLLAKEYKRIKSK
jgi:uncharacterized protein YeaO (DUF488 family)